MAYFTEMVKNKSQGKKPKSFKSPIETNASNNKAKSNYNNVTSVAAKSNMRSTKYHEVDLNRKEQSVGK